MDILFFFKARIKYCIASISIYCFVVLVALLIASPVVHAQGSDLGCSDCGNPTGSLESGTLKSLSNFVLDFVNPQVSSMLKVEEIPIDYFNGTANISIPLYTFSDGKLSIPININYRNSGLKVSERASWVGLGWSLTVGGMVSRTMRGLPDETLNIGYIDKGYNNLEEDLPIIDPSPTDYGEGRDLPKEKKDILTSAIEQKNYDTEPDKFFVSTPTISGEFFIGPNGNFVFSHSPRKAKIEYQNDLFIITDVSGIKYTFDKKQNTISNVSTYNNGNPVYSENIGGHTTGWLLTKIEHPQSENALILQYSDSTGSSGGRSYSETGIFYKEVQDLFCTNLGHMILKNETVSSTKIYYLDKVYFTNDPTSYIQFTISEREDLTADRRLDEISIYKNSQLVKKIKFDYGYFGLTNGNQRLKLNKIYEVDIDNSPLPGYEFMYFGENSSLPSYESYDYDYWGYYNYKGGQTNTTLVPKPDQITGFTGVADRTPSPILTTLLNKITYPTGGEVSFTYEGNSYSFIGNSQQNTSAPAGGMRVKTITYYDGVTSSNNITKTLVYEQNSLSSGRIELQPFYQEEGSALLFDSNGEMNKYCENIKVRPSSVFQIGDFNPLNLGYTKVTEMINTGNGKTEYYFEKNPYSHGGNLVKINTYDQNGYLLTEKMRDYLIAKYQSSFGAILGMEETIFYGWVASAIGEVGRDTTWSTRTYKINSYTQFLDTETSRIYNPGTNNYVENTVSYTYRNDFSRVATQTFSGSSSPHKSIAYTYAADVDGYEGMETLNMYSQLYSVSTSGWGFLNNKQWTLWKPWIINNDTTWLPCGQWVWDSSQQGSPIAPTSCTQN